METLKGQKRKEKYVTLTKHNHFLGMTRKLNPHTSRRAAVTISTDIPLWMEKSHRASHLYAEVQVAKRGKIFF